MTRSQCIPTWPACNGSGAKPRPNVCSAKPNDYTPRENNLFRSGAETHVYTELVGFGWRKSGDLWRTDLIVDVSVKTAAGVQIFQQNEFQKLQLSSRVHNREFMAHIMYTLSGLPPGKYLIDTTLRDAVSGKNGAFSLAFLIQ